MACPQMVTCLEGSRCVVGPPGGVLQERAPPLGNSKLVHRDFQVGSSRFPSLPSRAPPRSDNKHVKPRVPSEGPKPVLTGFQINAILAQASKWSEKWHCDQSFPHPHRPVGKDNSRAQQGPPHSSPTHWPLWVQRVSGGDSRKCSPSLMNLEQ